MIIGCETLPHSRTSICICHVQPLPQHQCSMCSLAYGAIFTHVSKKMDTSCNGYCVRVQTFVAFHMHVWICELADASVAHAAVLLLYDYI
jgi:hypothetical protein